MNDLRWKACLALTAALIATPGAARIVTDEQPGHLTCNTVAGEWDNRIVEQLLPGNRMAGRIRLVAAAPHRRFPPTAGFSWTENADSRPIGLQLIQRREDPENLVAVLRVPTGQKHVNLVRVPANGWIPISVSLSPDGRLEAIVAGSTFRHRVRTRPGLVPIVMCNSGTFDLELEPGMRPSRERLPLQNR